MSAPIGHRQSASSGGSIAVRKRVGSLSQRNDNGLTPLDIQSIQMPLNPQNALALKTASLASTKSLYQTCSALRKRLRCVEDFAPFLEQPSSAEPLDVVTHMCHMFRLGSPLCHIYNLLIPAFVDPESPLYADLPPPKHIEYDFPAIHDCPEGVRNWAKRPENAKMCQKYIAMFCMAMKQRQSEGRWQMEIWALHELWGKSGGADADGYDSNGLMKVLQTVEAMLDYLPDSAMSPLSPNTPYTASSSAHALAHMSRQSYDIPFSMGGTGSGASAVSHMAATMNGGVHIHGEGSSSAGPYDGIEMARGLSKTSADANAFKSVEELVSSEKSYVQELEILVRCSAEMLEHQLVSTDTNHQMFSNLPKILEFHRKFLIKLETEYEHISEGRGPKAWAEGRWGLPFVTSEPEFDCYGPYCANYLEAITVVNEQLPNLLRGQDLPQDQQPCLHPERELQAFMIKPIQRITKYGLLLDAILHATAKHDYPYRSELEHGAAAVRRIAANINEVTDFKAKQATIRELQDRVEDWKGHQVEKFGDLYLDDNFSVIKADQPRDYHVFLFEKMLLCCKEIIPERSDRSKKGSKNSSMLRKDKTASKTNMPEKRKLALKGRIFVSNVHRATVYGDNASGTSNPRLEVAWTVPQRNANGWPDDSEDSLVMAGKSVELLQKWADKVMELANEERRKQELRRQDPQQLGRYSSSDRYQQSAFAPPTPAAEHPPFVFPPSVPRHGEEEDEYQSGFNSGRTTPSIGSSATYMQHSYGHANGRRVQSQQAPPVDRQAEIRARALTEDQFGPSMTQWRSQQPPPLPRLTSAMSAMSTMSAASEASFGNVPHRGPGRQMSQSRLARAEEIDEDSPTHPTSASAFQQRYAPARGMTRAPSHQITPTVPYPHPPPLRSRSASSPNVYQIPKVSPAAMPPMPNSAWTEPSPVLAASSSSTLVGGTAYFTKRMSGGKRSSGESHSTETSETSSQQSPATPYGMVPGDGRGATPVSRQNSQDTDSGATMLVRVRCAEDQFVISVPEAINFDSFYHKVLKKIRMCSRSNMVTDSIQIKWIDADNDEITVKCDADIEAMFGECKDSKSNCVNLIAR